MAWDDAIEWLEDYQPGRGMKGRYPARLGAISDCATLAATGVPAPDHRAVDSLTGEIVLHWTLGGRTISLWFGGYGRMNGKHSTETPEQYEIIRSCEISDGPRVFAPFLAPAN